MENILIILGPTGVGKTDVAIQLAFLLNGEIISADSRAFYRFMDIGTAKPSQEERQRVRHHLIDIKEPEESYDVMQFRKDAIRTIAEIRSCGKRPIVVGGSTLYVEVLTDPLFNGPGADKKLRAKLEGEPLEQLYVRLKQVDPQAAGKIHENDRQRIIRALEVYELTGRPISELQKEPSNCAKHLPYKFVKVGLRIRRKLLYKRIDERVDEMIANGLIEEALLLKERVKPGMQVYRTVGYQELFSYLDGHLSLEEAIALIKKNTRHLAKRQLTFFARDPEITWIDVSGKDVEEVIEEIVTL